MTNEQVLEAFQILSRTEGIIPALESAHAVAWALEHAGQMGGDQIVLLNISGRGDKDVEQAYRMLGKG